MHLICSLKFCITFVFHSQPRSQGFLLPTLRSERERLWKTLVTCLPESLSLRRAGRRDPWERGWEWKTGYYSSPKSNWKQCLWKIFGAQIRCIMREVQVAYAFKTKVHFGWPVVACPRATATEYLITYIRTVWQTQPFDSRLRVRRSRVQKFKFSSKAADTRKRMFLKPHTFFTKQPFVHTKPVNCTVIKTALQSGLRPCLHESW